MFLNIDAWKSAIESDWKSLHEKAVDLEIKSPYQILMAMLFLPFVPLEHEQRVQSLQQLKKNHQIKNLLAPHHDTLVQMNTPEKCKSFVSGLEKHLYVHTHQRSHMDELILSIGLLPIMNKDPKKGKMLVQNLLDHFRNADKQPNGLRVQAESLSTGENLIIAGGDVNFSVDYYHGDKVALLNYLAELRIDWGVLEINSILMNPSKHISTQVYHLYTPIDVWDNQQLDNMSENEKSEIRTRSVENDLSRYRISIVESLALHPHVVLIGGPGTGKSTFCRFLAVCLSYMCDPDAEKVDKVHGKDFIGSAWIHGPLLPIYVNLRSFANDTKYFPKTARTATAATLLKYLKAHAGPFGEHMDNYLNQRNDKSFHAVLILDGLDEIYDVRERGKVIQMIENFVDCYPKCRLLVSCRTAIYQQDVKSTLSDRFTKLEIAPYTWSQISTYINNWYSRAALTRPGNFGGRDHAHLNTHAHALDLIQALRNTGSLWSIARQPLLLVLITFIHETHRGLPKNRADLYERAVELLHRWNPPSVEEPIAQKLRHLDYQRLREILQLIAFELQRENSKGMKRAVLLEWLITENKEASLGVAVTDVFEYLTTRNGILVAAKQDEYHFIHLSIQEYLSACALMGQYDRLRVNFTDKQVTASTPLFGRSEEEWSFPNNICNLSLSDPLRWREVVLFCGSILAGQAGQDGRWNFIEHLLPKSDKANLSTGEVNNVYLAAEVWNESALRCQLRTHHQIKQFLVENLRTIMLQQRLDIPEQSRAKPILIKLTDEQKAATVG